MARRYDRILGDAGPTCQHVVAEHYHTDTFVFSRKHSMILRSPVRDAADGCKTAGTRRSVNIAQNKFAVLHSSYWGRGYEPWTALYRDMRPVAISSRTSNAYKDPRITPWEGMLAEDARERRPGEILSAVHRSDAIERAREESDRLRPAIDRPTAGRLMLSRCWQKCWARMRRSLRKARRNEPTYDSSERQGSRAPRSEEQKTDAFAVTSGVCPGTWRLGCSLHPCPFPTSLVLLPPKSPSTTTKSC